MTSTIDELFDFFYADDKQRRILENNHGLRMADKDQISKPVRKCVEAMVPLSSAEGLCLRRSQHPQLQLEPPTCFFSGNTAVSEYPSGYVSASSSTLTDQSQYSVRSMSLFEANFEESEIDAVMKSRTQKILS